MPADNSHCRKCGWSRAGLSLTASPNPCGGRIRHRCGAPVEATRPMVPSARHSLRAWLLREDRPPCHLQRPSPTPVMFEMGARASTARHLSRVPCAERCVHRHLLAAIRLDRAERDGFGPLERVSARCCRSPQSTSASSPTRGEPSPCTAAADRWPLSRCCSALETREPPRETDSARNCSSRTAHFVHSAQNSPPPNSRRFTVRPAIQPPP